MALNKLNSKLILFLSLLLLFMFPIASAIVSHPASQVEPGSFQAGNYDFPNGNVTVSTGKLGIGTSVLGTWSLDVHSPTGANVGAFSADAADSAQISLYEGSGTTHDVRLKNLDGNVSITTQNDSAASIQLLYMNKDGNVGVGTTSPNLGESTGTIMTIYNGGDSKNSGLELVGNRSGALSGVGYLSFHNVQATTQASKKVAEVMGVIGVSGNLDSGGLLFRTVDTGGITRNRMLIDEDGKVGIGTLSPLQKFYVNGTAGNSTYIATDADTGWNSGILMYNAGVAKFTMRTLGTNADFEVAYYNDSGVYFNAMYFNRSNGNVGIRTSTPTQTLHVQGNLNVTGTSYLGNIVLTADEITTNSVKSKDGNISFKNASGYESLKLADLNGATFLTLNSVGRSSFVLYESNTNKAWSIDLSNGSGAGGDKDLVFYESPSGARMTLQDTTGYVGVGTTNPQTRLHSAYADNAVQLRLERTNTAANYTDLGASGDIFGIYPGGYPAAGKSLIINVTNGNVGIGTTTPAAPLSFPSGSGEKIRVNNDAPYGIGLESVSGYSTTTVYGNQDFGSAAVSLGMKNATSYYPQLNVLQNGKVGIGTMSPGGKFGVADSTNNGSIFFAFDSTRNYIESTNSSANGNRDLWITGAAAGSTGELGLIATQVYMNGKLGIGTQSPSGKLDVRGTFDIWQDGTQVRHYNSTGSQLLYETLGSTSYDWKNGSGTSMLTIEHISGNVGIGTTTPISRLDVRNTLNAGRTLSLGSTTTGEIGDKEAELVFTKGTGFYDSWKLYTLSLSSGNGRADLYLDTYLNATTFKNVMTFKENGNIGIGTSNPASNLYINSSGATRLTLDGGAASSPYIDFLQGGSQQAYIQYSNGIAGLYYKANNNWFENGIQIAGAGYNPRAKLTVVANDGTYYIAGINAESAQTSFYVKDGLGPITIGNNRSQAIHFANSDGQTRMTITGGGNIGINATSPSSLLHMYGTNATLIIEGPTQETTTVGKKGTRVLLTNPSTTVNAGSDIVFATYPNDVAQYRYAAIGSDLKTNGAGNAGGAVYIATKSQQADTTLTKRLYVSAEGNIGINNVDPAAKLDIGSALYTNEDFIRLGRTSWAAYDGNHSSIKWIDYSGPNNMGAIGLSYNSSDGTGMSYLDIHSLYNGGNKTDSDIVMRIKGNGNVGIGTKTPSNLLDLYKSSLSDNSRTALLELHGKFASGSVDYQDEVGIAFTLENNAGSTQTTTSITSGYASGYNNLNLQPAGGNVGIGTNNPKQRLEVNSVMRLTPTDTPGTCNADAFGSVYFDNSLALLCYCDGATWNEVYSNNAGTSTSCG